MAYPSGVYIDRVPLYLCYHSVTMGIVFCNHLHGGDQSKFYKAKQYKDNYE